MKGGPWTCFHCDDRFVTETAARRHFGRDESYTPACQIKSSEGGLLRALREAEETAADYAAALHAESADGVKAYRGNLSRHAAALGAQEEIGYERGLADRAAEIERLRRIIHRYGDRGPMATCHRADWQQEIDEAMSFVADNPEMEAAK